MLGHQLRPLLDGVYTASVEVTGRTSVMEAMDVLEASSFAAVVVDFTHPATTDLGQIGLLAARLNTVPILVTVPRGDQLTAASAVQAGAQDWLPHDGITADLLSKCIAHAQERLQLREMLSSMSLVDEATHLYNATGFMAVATPMMERVVRQDKPSLFIGIEVLGLDELAAEKGAHEKQNALMRTAEILRSTFRRTDILARLAPATFGVLAVDAAVEDFLVMAHRVGDAVKARSESERWSFALHLSMGYVQIDQETTSHDANWLLESARASVTDA